MKILLVTSAYLPTINGVTVHVENLYNSMTRKGHHVTILCPQNKNRANDTDIASLKSIYNPFNSDYPLPIGFSIPKKIKIADFDLIHLHHPFGVRGIAEKIARDKKIPIIFTNHTQYLEYAEYYLPIIKIPAKKYIKNSLKSLYKGAAIVLCSTKDTEKSVKNIYSKANTKVIPVPFNDESLNNEKMSVNLREKYNFRPEDFIFLYVGRVANEKNMNLLIKAYNEASIENKKLKLIIGGNGDILESLKAKNSNIIFTGRIEQKDLANFYRQADIFVSASTSETLGLVFAEAAHCGTPLLGIDSPGVRDVIKSGVNGWLARNEKEFKTLFSEIPKDKKVKEFRKDCQKSVEYFSLSHNIEEIENIYESVIKNQSI